MESLGGGQRLQNNEIRVVAPGGCQCYFGRLCAADLFLFFLFFSLGRWKCMLAAVRLPIISAPLCWRATQYASASSAAPNQEEGREGIPASSEKKKKKKEKCKVPNAVRITATLISAWR